MSTAENPHAGQGMVVLDIGGDIGALVVTAPAAMAGVEIEICPAGARERQPDDGRGWWQGDWHNHPHDHDHDHDHAAAWPHVAVVGRPHGDRTTYAAVYPGLRCGEYELWERPNEATAVTVTVKGATITTIDWPATAPQSRRP
jgi:hypothetical protein